MYVIEIAEVKDHPPKLGRRKYHEEGRTKIIFLRLIKDIFRTVKTITLHSSFCVMTSIIALNKRGVYVSSLIKKIRYWPKFINGEAIKFYMADKEVGTQA